MIVSALAVMTSLCLSAAGSSEPANRPSTGEAMAELRQAVLENVPALKDERDPWRCAVLLRDHVHHATTVGPEKAPIPLTAEEYRKVVAGQSPQLCSGMSVLYHGLLQAFGMESRIVYMASRQAVASRTTDEAHTAVEVLLGRRWILHDPTFNIHWDLAGKPLGAEDLAKAFTEGRVPIPQTDGCSASPGRSVGEYHMPYGDLLGNVEISQLEVFSPNPGKYRVVKTVPAGPSWRYLVQHSNRVPYRAHLRDILSYWDFSRGMPEGWTPLSNVQAVTEGGRTVVKTGVSNSAYQLVGPVQDLTPGNYQVRIRGDVPAGGIELGILGARRGVWIAQAYYSAGPARQPDDGDMAVEFTVTETRPIQVVLANWSLEGKPSTWRLQSVMLLQTVPGPASAASQATTTATAPAASSSVAGQGQNRSRQ